MNAFLKIIVAASFIAVSFPSTLAGPVAETDKRPGETVSTASTPTVTTAPSGTLVPPDPDTSFTPIMDTSTPPIAPGTSEPCPTEDPGTISEPSSTATCNCPLETTVTTTVFASAPISSPTTEPTFTSSGSSAPNPAETSEISTSDFSAFTSTETDVGATPSGV